MGEWDDIRKRCIRHKGLGLGAAPYLTPVETLILLDQIDALKQMVENQKSRLRDYEHRYGELGREGA